jgi:hypothetical protein
MSIRTNEINNGGIVTVNVAGGNMPVDNYCNPTPYISRSTGTGNTVVTPTVTANGHAVEVGADGGCWDTVSGVIVQRDRTNLDTLSL